MIREQNENGTRIALFSEDYKYRYSLSILINEYKSNEVVFIMLNPSTADHNKNDPTVARCVNYATAWDFRMVTILNLFAMRSPYPTDLWKDETFDPIGGSDNDTIISEVCERAIHDGNGAIVCAWGNHGQYMDRGEQVLGQIEHLKNIRYLKLNKSGHPAHPLNLKKDLFPEQWINPYSVKLGR